MCFLSLGFANMTESKLVFTEDLKLSRWKLKIADFSLLAETAVKHVRSLIVFGQDADIIISELEKYLAQNAITDFKYSHAESLHNALLMAYQNSCEDEIILFSPACASFDMFENYKQRGDYFIAEVSALIESDADGQRQVSNG